MNFWEEITGNTSDLQKWLNKSRNIQWDYKNIRKRKGVLERLKMINDGICCRLILNGKE